MTKSEQIENAFTYHAPKGDQAERYGVIREHAKQYAQFLLDTCPESRELSVAITKLDEVVFWANASIVRNE